MNNNTIETKSDINYVLENRLNDLSIYMQKEFYNDTSFSFKQQRALDDFCRQVFYYLSDIKDAIKLLNK